MILGTFSQILTHLHSMGIIWAQVEAFFTVDIEKGTGGGTSFVNVDPVVGTSFPSAVPEPSSMVLGTAGSGLSLLLWFIRRKRIGVG